MHQCLLATFFATVFFFLASFFRQQTQNSDMTSILGRHSIKKQLLWCHLFFFWGGRLRSPSRVLHIAKSQTMLWHERLAQRKSDTFGIQHGTSKGTISEEKASSNQHFWGDVSVFGGVFLFVKSNHEIPSWHIKTLLQRVRFFVVYIDFVRSICDPDQWKNLIEILINLIHQWLVGG